MLIEVIVIYHIEMLSEFNTFTLIRLDTSTFGFVIWIMLRVLGISEVFAQQLFQFKHQNHKNYNTRKTNKRLQ